jgi:hypothetical protein
VPWRGERKARDRFIEVYSAISPDWTDGKESLTTLPDGTQR